jgi:glyoxalase family protein
VFELATTGPGFARDEDDPGSEEIDPFERGHESD